MAGGKIHKTIMVGSLFSGIGGFDLGLERAGMSVKWQVEIDPYCLKVLEKHWPHVKRYEDIKTIRTGDLEPVDLICGGFPCQDLSVAGKRSGLREGNRSGLWFEMFQIISNLRPRYVLVENVPGLLANHAMGRVLGDLSSIGYDAEWESIPASAFGAPHRRDRVWIVGYAKCFRRNWHNIWIRTKEEKRRVQKFERSTSWCTEPAVCRVAYGIPARVDRLKGLGNAVVPQIATWIGERIIEFDDKNRKT